MLANATGNSLTLCRCFKNFNTPIVAASLSIPWLFDHLTDKTWCIKCEHNYVNRWRIVTVQVIQTMSQNNQLTSQSNQCWYFNLYYFFCTFQTQNSITIILQHSRIRISIRGQPVCGVLWRKYLLSMFSVLTSTPGLNSNMILLFRIINDIYRCGSLNLRLLPDSFE